jgi:hypothetical protein
MNRIGIVCLLIVLVGTSLGLGGCGEDATQVDFTPPAVIDDLRASGVDSSTILLHWTAPGDDGVQGRASTYEVRFTRTNGERWDRMQPVAGVPAPAPAGSRDSVFVGGLASLTTHHFRIRTGDEVPNWSEPSDQVSATTLQGIDRIPPAAVSDLEVSAVEPSSVLLTWTAPGDDGNRGTAWSYDVRYWGTETPSWDEAEQVDREPFPRAAGEVDSIRVSGLETNHLYFFALRTSDEAGNESGLSTVVSTMTADAQDIHWWDGFAPPPRGQGIAGAVHDLIVYDASLIAAGLFPAAGDTVARNISRWDGERWRPLGGGTNGPVYHLEVFEGDLIVSGDFTFAGDVFANGIASFNGTEWDTLGDAQGSGPLVAWDGDLVAVGNFQQGEDPPARIARWDGSDWTGMGPVPLEAVHDLVVFQGELYAAGWGTEAGADEAFIFLIRWVGDRWVTLSRSAFVHSDGIGPDIRDLLVNGQELWAGGTSWGGVGSFIRFVARWDGNGWLRRDEGLECEDSIPREACSVEALGLLGDEPIAVGLFYRVDGWDAPGVARWNGSRWTPLGSGMRDVSFQEENVEVNCVVTFEGRLYVGGRFNGAGRKGSWNIARWDP